MNSSIGAKIAKIAVGAVFIASMFGSSEADSGTKATGCVIGLALIAWGVISWISDVSAEKRKERAQAERERKIREQIQAQKKAEDERPKLCSRCGASTKGSVCEYCGSPLDD